MMLEIKFCNRQRSMVIEMFEVHFKDRNRTKNMMQTVGLNGRIDQLAIANSMCYHGH